MGFIRIQIQPFEHPGPRDIDRAFPISGEMARKTFEPLDLPHLNADGLERMLCTNPVTIREVMVNRGKWAKMIADHVVDVLMDSMEFDDTEMGYKHDGPTKYGNAR